MCQRRDRTGGTDAITGVAILGVPYDYGGDAAGGEADRIAVQHVHRWARQRSQRRAGGDSGESPGRPWGAMGSADGHAARRPSVRGVGVWGQRAQRHRGGGQGGQRGWGKWVVVNGKGRGGGEGAEKYREQVSGLRGATVGQGPHHSVHRRPRERYAAARASIPAEPPQATHSDGTPASLRRCGTGESAVQD